MDSEQEIKVGDKTFTWDEEKREYIRWITVKGAHIPIPMTNEEAAQAVGRWTDEAGENFAIQGGGLDGAIIPEGRVPSRDELFTPYPKGFRYITDRKELIQFAKKEFGIDAAELSKVVDVDVANAINCELLRAKELFGVLPAIKNLGTYKGKVKALKDGTKEIIWGRYVPESQKMLIRVSDPEDGKLMTYKKWRELTMTLYAEQKCSTYDWRQIFRHEIGHGYVYAVLNMFGEYECGKRMKHILTQIENQGIATKQALSMQATLVWEIIAESFAVIMNGIKNNNCANIAVNTIMEGLQK